MKIFKNKILILLSCVFLISMVMCITVSAARVPTDDCSLCSEEHDLTQLDLIQYVAYIMNSEISNGNLFYSSPAGSDVSTERILRLDLNDPVFSQLVNYADGINSVLVPIALILCVIWGCLNIITAATEDMLTPEKLCMSLVKMFIGLFILTNWFSVGSRIIDIAMDFGTIVFSNLDKGLNGGVPDSPLCNYQTILDEWWAAVFDILSLAVVFIIVQGIKVVITFLAWIRLIEVLIRMAFAPIPLADITYEGTQSNGFSYIKKLIASVLQASVIVAGSSAYTAIISSITATSGAFVGRSMMIVLAFVFLVIVFRSQSLASDIVGVS